MRRNVFLLCIILLEEDEKVEDEEEEEEQEVHCAVVRCTETTGTEALKVQKCEKFWVI